jgi:hypothetical protein
MEAIRLCLLPNTTLNHSNRAQVYFNSVADLDVYACQGNQLN